MEDLEIGTWPVAALTTERLVLREAREVDRDGVIALLSNAEVHRYLGGPMSRVKAEEAVQPPYGVKPGSFAIRADPSDEYVGGVFVKRRDPNGPMGGALDVGYLLLPEYWGKGYAQEAVGAVLRWLPTVVPDEQVTAVTQAANESSRRLLKRLGFSEVARFEAFGAEQGLYAAELPR